MMYMNEHYNFRKGFYFTKPKLEISYLITISNLPGLEVPLSRSYMLFNGRTTLD